MAALPTSPWRDPALVLLIIGFGLKIGLVPLYVWMPLAYTAAPAPAAAVLSGAAVKAGVIGLIRFLPFDTALPGLGAALAAAGIISTFYGVAIGINRSNPKTVLAYSSVSQMGVIATLLGMGLATANSGVTLAAGFYAAHHVLVKGALFLATGIVLATGSRSRWLIVVPAAIVALGLAGLPFTGGYLAKAAVKPFIGEGVIRNFCGAIVSRHGALDALFHRLPYESAPAKRWRASAGRSDASVARHGIRRNSCTFGAVAVCDTKPALRFIWRLESLGCNLANSDRRRLRNRVALPSSRTAPALGRNSSHRKRDARLRVGLRAH